MPHCQLAVKSQLLKSEDSQSPTFRLLAKAMRTMLYVNPLAHCKIEIAHGPRVTNAPRRSIHGSMK